jgi:hypothetical protein
MISDSEFNKMEKEIMKERNMRKSIVKSMNKRWKDSIRERK